MSNTLFVCKGIDAVLAMNLFFRSNLVPMPTVTMGPVECKKHRFGQKQIY